MRLKWWLDPETPTILETGQRIVSIGSDPGNDLAVPDADLAPHHAHLMQRGPRLQIGSIGGHRFTLRGVLETQGTLGVGDRIVLGRLHVEVLPPATEEHPPRPADDDVLDRLGWFADRLATLTRPEDLLDQMLDLLMSTLRADRGFVVVEDGEARRIVAARGIDGARLEAELNEVPDRLLERVRETGEPLAHVDVETDRDLRDCTSVMRLGLKAVLAIPLRVADETFGTLLLASPHPTPQFSDAGLKEVRLYGAQASLLVGLIERQKSLAHELEQTRDALEASRTGALLCASEPMRAIQRLIDRLAPSDLAVLITGETGTGKEITAREIHARSGRAGSFVPINCGAIPETLIESELFGHARGAFTGAVADRAGSLEQADGGTLFLDEIGEMPPTAQVKLLRALQERSVTRLGESAPRTTDFRLLAATNRDLDAAVADGAFREDLYYRIRETELALPPLRDREDDVLLLARHFRAEQAARLPGAPRGFSPASEAGLKAHRWPGNVRELMARVKRAVVMAEGDLIEPIHLDLAPAAGTDASPDAPLEEQVQAFRARIIARALAEHDGNRRRTARALGIDERTLYRHLSRAGNPET